LILRKIFKKIMVSREAYFSSEKFYFDQLKKKKDKISLYRWYDEFRKETNLPPELRKVIKMSINGKENWPKAIKQIQDLRSTNSVDKPANTGAYTINP